MADSIRNVLESDVVDGSGIPEVQTVDGRECRRITLPCATEYSVDLHREGKKRDGSTLGDR
jgi:hypothetical protein